MWQFIFISEYGEMMQNKVRFMKRDEDVYYFLVTRGWGTAVLNMPLSDSGRKVVWYVTEEI